MYRNREVNNLGLTNLLSWLPQWKVLLFLLFLLLSSVGILATAMPTETTYKSQIPGSDSKLVLNGDGLTKNGVPDDVYIWTSPDGVKRGYWYKMNAADNHIYLQMDSALFSDLVLDVKGNTIFWPNGSEWVKS